MSLHHSHAMLFTATFFMEDLLRSAINRYLLTMYSVFNILCRISEEVQECVLYCTIQWRLGERYDLVEKERNKNVNSYQWRRQDLSLSSSRREEQGTWEDEQCYTCIFPHSCWALVLPGKYI